MCNKENYLNLVLLKNEVRDSNVIGYLKADYEEVKCPKVFHGLSI